MTKQLLAAFGAAGLLTVSGGAFAADTSASATVDDNGVATTSAQATGTGSKTDSKLEKKIESKLEHDKQLKSDHVAASVSDGNVTLTGTVDRDADKSRAERLVSAMKGVKNVDNQIQVSSDSLMAPGAAGSALPSQGSSDMAPSTQGATGVSGSSSDQSGSIVRERTNRVEEHREVEVQRPSQRSSGSMNSEREMRDQTSGSRATPDPVDSLPGSGTLDNTANPGSATSPSGSPRPLPLPSEPASPSRRSTDNPGTERLPSSPSSGYHELAPGSSGASPSSPLR